MSNVGKKTRRIFDQRFELVGELGRGKKSVVYHALHDGKQGADVALKVLLPVKTLDSLKSRLRAEAQAMLMAQHPYVLGLKDFQYYDNLSYIALEYAPLGDLRKYASSNGGKLPQAQVELFLRQIAEALHFIHSLGLIHRDVKPDNILAISPDEVRLADFGVALIQENPAISADLNAAIGTMDYLAPEVLDGKEYGPQGDIYSLGITVYELISGVHPFANLPLANMMEARLNGPRPIDELVPDISTSLATTIELMLQSDISRRFKKASEIIDSLNRSSERTATSPKTQTLNNVDNAENMVSSESTSVAAATNSSNANQIEGSDSLSDNLGYSHEGEDPSQIIPITESDLVTTPSGVNNSSEVYTSRHDEPDKHPKEMKTSSGLKSNEDIPPPAHKIVNSAIWGARETKADLDFEAIEEDHSNDSQEIRPRSLRGNHSSNDQMDDHSDGNTSISSLISRGPKLTQKFHSKNKLAKNSAQHAQNHQLIDDDSDSLDTFAPLPRRRMSLLRACIIIGALCLVGISAYKLLFSDSSSSKDNLHLKPRSEVLSLEQKKSGQLGGAVASISQLKPGIYNGSLTGVLTKSPLPLFFDVKESGIFVFLGVQGWTPVRADVIDDARMEVSSNGLVLSLKISGPDFSGTVQDLLSGETGFWNVQSQVERK